jgi:catechol 2,3-dioxygenase-like lactoylglutathione lyase family enzyme
MKAANRVTFVVTTLLTTMSAFGQAQRPAITGIAYVRIYTSDLSASEKFYTERLQLPAVPCAIGGDCRQYEVGKDQYVQAIKANGRVNGMEVVAFRTSDAAALRTYLAAHKANVPNAVQKHSDGSQEFEMTDPEGHHIAFLQPGKSDGKQGAISHRMIHIGLVVKDRAAMDGFYKDVLGFRPYWYGGWKEDHPVWVSSQVPEGTDWMEYMLDVKPDADHHLLGVMNHFSLGIVDINDAAAGLAKSGWKPNDQEHTQTGRDGKRQLNVWDPDEVRIEFMEFKPTQKPCCSEFTARHPTAD